MTRPTSISCVVLDDEFPAVNLLSDYVKKTSGMHCLLKTTSALDALDFLQTHQVDLLFLDVQMPELTGMELIKIIRSSNIKVVLTTAYSAYALEGFDNDVVDYLLKPITFERFLVSVGKVRSRLDAELAISHGMSKETLEYIFVKTEYRVQKVMLASILYIEGLGDYVTLHTTAGKILSLERMKNMDELLGNEFLRIHKSFIINILHVDFIEKGRIVIAKEYLPVGESYKDVVKLKLKL